MATPLQPIYFVRELGASDGWIGIWLALYLGVFVTAMNLGFFLATLLCAPLVDLIGAQTLVLVLAVLRLGGALLFVVNPVRAPVAEAAAGAR
jgi:predicted MFS family arabinose efflux permease